MAAFAPYMAIAPMLYTANTNSATSNGVTYRVAEWTNIANSTTANTYPIGWDQGTGTTGATVYEMNYIEYATLDTPYVQVARGPGYTVRVVRYDQYAAINGWDNSSPAWQAYPQKTPAERLKEILEGRMAPRILTGRKTLGITTDVREMRARETLRRVLGEDKFRNFIRRGSVSVQAKSGLVYQIFPGHDFTKVYDRGKLVEQLCVVLQGEFPPTDSLIMRYLMILNNEQQFRGYANKHGVYTPAPQVEPDQRSLVEIFKELKRVA